LLEIPGHELADRTTERPTAETLMAWADEGGCRATDGCRLAQEEDVCEHAYPSWAIVLGLAPTLEGE
jgi:hypothetical protein